ncbi:uncharacterized protein LOC111694904 [Eurytemora carolleeae]|uniref:uncharacterized protein LOC111694904 n=1 Tax=Eurytemora carolleeae TaxID=1294199 RepID=UPI000C76B3BB|nr:uncharacterized protein LOC111694904 [Eurytemora carolleeae]|eukprot:XP_023319728.1 uncharacterized protein LOC111694904 [Eurytemora affinis]
MRGLIVLALVGSSFAARQLQAQGTLRRQEKSLLNTFPFNAKQHAEHQAHASEREPSVNIPARDALQGADTGLGGVAFGDVAAAKAGSDGKRCIDKVEMVEETEYDEVVQCDHSYDRRCHTTYVTNYESQQEEECEENFRKNCFIDYEKIAFNETVEVCRTPLVKDCDVSGPEICRTEYESECWTKQEEHDVQDDVVTCETIQDEKCADETSGYTTCAHVTKLVPKLEPTEECVDVPKEVCTRSRTNPRKVKKPVVKKWCYIPSAESGLA